MLDLLKLYLHGAENIKNFIVKHLTFKAAFTATSHKTAGWLSMLETHLVKCKSMIKIFQDGDGGRCYQECYAEIH